jgi:hypothetical protein
MSQYSGWVKEAYDETDKAKSIAAWQRIFGEDFKAPDRWATWPRGRSWPACTLHDLSVGTADPSGCSR